MSSTDRKSKTTLSVHICSDPVWAEEAKALAREIAGADANAEIQTMCRQDRRSADRSASDTVRARPPRKSAVASFTGPRIAPVRSEPVAGCRIRSRSPASYGRTHV